MGKQSRLKISNSSKAHQSSSRIGRAKSSKRTFRLQQIGDSWRPSSQIRQSQHHQLPRASQLSRNNGTQLASKEAKTSTLILTKSANQMMDPETLKIRTARMARAKARPTGSNLTLQPKMTLSSQSATPPSQLRKAETCKSSISAVRSLIRHLKSLHMVMRNTTNLRIKRSLATPMHTIPPRLIQVSWTQRRLKRATSSKEISKEAWQRTDTRLKNVAKLHFVMMTKRAGTAKLIEVQAVQLGNSTDREAMLQHREGNSTPSIRELIREH